MRRLISIALYCFSCIVTFAQVQDGNLQIHHMDIGQGDAAVLISPLGQVVLLDAGEDLKKRDCQSEIAYLDQLGVQQIDYIFISHYHFDHIGGVPAVLKKFPVKGKVYDRNFKYPGATYIAYTDAIGDHREEGKVGTLVSLDSSSPTPVLIRVMAEDGKSSHASVETTNENDLSLSVLVSFGAFREEIGGDLSGEDTDDYQDVETPVASDVGPIDVYKVHHHCSSYSSNAAWLGATHPTIGIISVGDGNGYGHPAQDCVIRLHNAGLKKLYWTEEGAGVAKPDPQLDVISGDVRIEVEPNATFYTVTYGGLAPDHYPIKGTANSGNPPTPPSPAPPKYAWSKRSSSYHDINCPDVKKILAENLVEGPDRPTDKSPAQCVKTAQ
jgi:competence protein ComEC